MHFDLTSQSDGSFVTCLCFPAARIHRDLDPSGAGDGVVQVTVVWMESLLTVQIVFVNNNSWDLDCADEDKKTF